MGEFCFQITEKDSGVELATFALPNFLADESAERVYRRIFPPIQGRQTLKMMLTGANYSFPLYAPNPRTGAGFSALGLTYAGLDDVASEGGCYTPEMQNSFGYQRRALSFSASKVSDQGFADSGWETWTNGHAWSPQAASAWDFPWRDDPDQGTIEQAPPEWGPRWNPALHQAWGFPWYAPRKKCGTDQSPAWWTPPTIVPSYFHQWQPDGSLDWLCNFHQMTFPIGGAAIVDESSALAFAVSIFPAMVFLWPGLSIHARYKALFYSRDGSAAGAFLHRWANRVFAGSMAGYTAIKVRPALATADPPRRQMVWADWLPHFDPEFTARTVGTWTFVAGPPHRVQSGLLSWPNSSGSDVGPIRYIVVYGELAAGDPEIMFVVTLDSDATIAHGDTLRLPNGVRYYLDNTV